MVGLFVVAGKIYGVGSTISLWTFPTTVKLVRDARHRLDSV